MAMALVRSVSWALLKSASRCLRALAAWIKIVNSFGRLATTWEWCFINIFKMYISRSYEHLQDVYIIYLVLRDIFKMDISLTYEHLQD
jgi:hypothetical protein